jgi:hypothetical protein
VRLGFLRDTGNGHIAEERVTLPSEGRVREPFQPWRCAYFRSAPAAIMRSG